MLHLVSYEAWRGYGTVTGLVTIWAWFVRHWYYPERRQEKCFTVIKRLISNVLLARAELVEMGLPVCLSLLLSVPSQTSPSILCFNLFCFCWKMEHTQCHLFTILHKYASLASIFKRKGQALSEYCTPNYSSSLHFLNLKNSSKDVFCCCFYSSYPTTV